DWGEAPHIEQFYGRDEELLELQRWVVEDHCRAVAILGIGGIGKTSLAVSVARQMRDAFAFVFWRSLHNAPPLQSILQDCITFVSDQRCMDLPEDIESRISLLVKYLREHRCLLVFDNVETILQGGKRAGS